MPQILCLNDFMYKMEIIPFLTLLKRDLIKTKTGTACLKEKRNFLKMIYFYHYATETNSHNIKGFTFQYRLLKLD